MNEEQARSWLMDQLDVSRETMARLEKLVAIIREEGRRQNLVAQSTLESFWSRHIVNSAQLVPLARDAATDLGWIDLGSGAGLPGLVVALLLDVPVTLVEMRRLRVEHLRHAVDLLDLGNRVSVCQAKVEAVPPKAYGVVSARAFAPLPRLFDVAHHLAGPDTVWLLPKGRNLASELEACRGSWQGSFNVESSVTDPEAAIVVATRLQPRRLR